MSDAIANVRQGYDRWASVYDHDANPLLALEEPQMRAMIGEPGGLEVLDLGCGTGRHAIWLAGAGARVTAVDFSAGMIEQARGKAGAEGIRFLLHDLRERLPFGDESFDLVICGLVLEHLRELGAFFVEIRRVLKRGGRAVVSGMHPAMFLRGSQARFTDPNSGELVQPGSVCHSVSEFVMGAIGAGLEVLDIAELAPDAEFAARFPRAQKYVGWPMLIVFSIGKK
jgi:ubiquinone/menaquinone biosynthesis C-methylase UbiE